MGEEGRYWEGGKGTKGKGKGDGGLLLWGVLTPLVQAKIYQSVSQSIYLSLSFMSSRSQ